jgi:hypothetical protein
MRRKAYLRFDSNADDDFRFLLAYTLKKFVWEVDELPHEEYVKWYVWLGRKRQYEELAAKPGQGR